MPCMSATDFFEQVPALPPEERPLFEQLLLLIWKICFAEQGMPDTNAVLLRDNATGYSVGTR